MASFARPSADIARGGWTTQGGATTNLWESLDEETADDADYVISAIGANSTYEVRLSSVAPAVIARDHTLFLRGAKHASGGNEKGVTVSLVQGTTVLGSLDFPSLPATVTQQNVAIPRSIAAGITDYADLRIRFTPTGPTTGGGNRRRVVITGVALRVPSAVDLVDDLLVRWNIVVESSNGTVTVSRSGFTGEGDNLARAVWELYQAMKAAGWQNAEVSRRWNIARSLWKHVEYGKLRDRILTNPTPEDIGSRTPEEALARVDRKLANFSVIAKSADAGDPD